MKLLLSLLQTSKSSSLDYGKTIMATKNQTTIRQLLHRPPANLLARFNYATIINWIENAPLNIVYAQ